MVVVDRPKGVGQNRHCGLKVGSSRIATDAALGFYFRITSQVQVRGAGEPMRPAVGCFCGTPSTADSPAEGGRHTHDAPLS